MLNGYVLFHAAEETQTTAGNATIRRRVRKFFHPTDFPTPAQSGYATGRREWSAPVADPLPETAPASSMLTGLHGQQWAEVWANVRAQHPARQEDRGIVLQENNPRRLRLRCGEVAFEEFGQQGGFGEVGGGSVGFGYGGVEGGVGVGQPGGALVVEVGEGAGF